MSPRLKFPIAAVLGLAGVLLFGVPSARADTGLEPKDVKAAKAMVDLVAALDADGVNVAKFLEDQGGFPPSKAGIEPHVWHSLPDVVKVQVMYRYAAANSPQGAEWMLFTLIKATQDGGHLPPGELPAGLKSYKDPPPQPEGVDINRPEMLYKLPEQLSERIDVTAETRADVHKLAARSRLWASGGPLNGLRSDFKMELSDAVKLLLEARTPERAYEHALPKAAGEQGPAIAAAKARLDKAWGVERGARGTAAPRPVITPLDEAKVIKEWEDRSKEQLPKPEDRTFDKIKEKAGFPGGILFGDRVTPHRDLGKPKVVAYVAGKDGAAGSITVTLTNETVLTLPGVSAEDAAVAAALAFNSKTGDGIPIIDIDGGTPYYQFGERRLVVGTRCPVLLNPELLNTNLGWAAIYIDCLPESRAWLLAQVKNDPLLNEVKNEDERRELERYRRQVLDWVFDPWRNIRRERVVKPDQLILYRIVDVPMKVAASGESLVVTRDNGDAELTESLLEMQVLIQTVDKDRKPVGESESLTEYTKESARLMPALVTFSPEFRRLSEFARLLAVFRWLRDNDVKTLGDAPAKPKGGPPTPGFVATTPTEITPLDPFKPDEVAKADIQKATNRRAKLLEVTSVKAFDAQATKFLDALAAVSKTKEGSDDRKAALEKLAELEKEFDQLSTAAPVVYLRALVYLEFDYKAKAISEKRFPKGKEPDIDGAIEDVHDLRDELGRSMPSVAERYWLLIISQAELRRIERMKQAKSKEDKKPRP
ncbi:hypothetical protein VT84_12455 [Gemmata sp. SH-PL17]|uniref:hypothetical protein n=1 Tax=Gemmata sp. SH-PL17 TaxID=1630693 RepID=UPI00078E8095|nr:hypothetical protein [Gemmata sp. SH-PL17]AMV25202.1 hypothetical protein VT84_12455 [Gemmata sp. SH-PL17]